MVSERDCIPARPRTVEEIDRLPGCPAIAVAAERRRISQVVHFTTTTGAVGIIAAEAVKSRKRVSSDKYLEHVYQPNAAHRKDPEWLDYVNLSVERINNWMFSHSTKWHPVEHNPWVILSFRPCVLTHPGVVFTTTNNIYPACKRAEGLAGFSLMFTDTVLGRYDERHSRTDGMLAAWPTDRQAEVLYPGELSCDHLQQIDVQLERSLEDIEGALGVLGLDVPVCLAPEVFE